MTHDLNRTPADLAAALELIADLRCEIRRRPQAVVIDAVTIDRFSDVFRAITPQTTRIEIIADGKRYAFQACVCTETPDFVQEVEECRDASGNVAIVPTLVRPQE